MSNTPEKNTESAPAQATVPEKDKKESYGLHQKVALVTGPLLALVVVMLPSPSGMPPEAQRVAAVALLMAIYWISEAIPIPATSLLPVALFPLLGVMPSAQSTLPYGNHVIFLFMGGFIIALAMQRWNLHRRIALHIINAVGFSPDRLVIGFMLATALLSAFVSNTATSIMMLPIGMAVIMQITSELNPDKDAPVPAPVQTLSLNLMLGIAYAASIGGIATLVGTPPNIVLASYLEKTYGYEITFFNWMMVGVPLACLFLPFTWFWLTRVVNRMPNLTIPNAEAIIHHELEELGPVTPAERWTGLVFGLTSLGWIFRDQIASVFPQPDMIKDATIALVGALSLFLIPVDFKKRIFVMDWKWAAKLPWGVLILFGGGLSLAKGFEVSGLAAWIVDQVTILQGMPVLVIICGVTVLVIFLTEFTSNTATSTMLMPVLAGVAIGLGESPLLLLAPAAMAASCAFMLPVATPPNAIVFGSRYVSMRDMVRSGLGLNLIGIVLIPAVTYLIMIPAFDIMVGKLPEWVK